MYSLFHVVAKGFASIVSRLVWKYMYSSFPLKYWTTFNLSSHAYVSNFNRWHARGPYWFVYSTYFDKNMLFTTTDFSFSSSKWVIITICIFSLGGLDLKFIYFFRYLRVLLQQNYLYYAKWNQSFKVPICILPRNFIMVFILDSPIKFISRSTIREKLLWYILLKKY